MLSFYGWFNVAGACIFLWILTRNLMACGYAPAMVIVTVAAIVIELLRIPPPTFYTAQEKWSNLSVIAHRGAAMDGPENTLYAIKQAAANGAEGVEVDVGLTKDNQLILLHDDSLDRTTDHSGLLSGYTLAQLARVDASCKHPLYSRCGIQNLPTLRSAVLLALRLDLSLFVDLKASESAATLQALSKLYDEIPEMHETCIIGSFSPYLIYQVRKAIPKAAVAITHQHNNYQFTADGTPKTSTDWDSTVAFLKDRFLEWSHHTWIWYMVGNSWFVVHKSDISPNYIKFWKERNVRLIAWTVNERVVKDYLKHFGIPIMTDTLLD